jgi:hypothetical protein
MVTNINGHLEAGVAQLFFNLNHARSIASKQAGKGMPDVVKANVP